MKHFILMLLLSTALVTAKAQSAYLLPSTAADTLSNADTIVKNIDIPAGLSGVILQPVITRVSGTAAGKIVLSQSIDGANFIATDSVTLSNAVTNTAFITKTAPNALYYRITFISSGTTVLWPRLYYLLRKEK